MCQFSGLETITSAIIDLFPGQMRRPWRREIFLVIFCSMSFLVQILLITEVFGLSRKNPILCWAVLSVFFLNFTSELHLSCGYAKELYLHQPHGQQEYIASQQASQWQCFVIHRGACTCSSWLITMQLMEHVSCLDPSSTVWLLAGHLVSDTIFFGQLP